MVLTIKERELVLQWNQKGKSQEDIASLLGCHQSSISRLLKKYDCESSLLNLPRSGRPTKLTKKNLSLLKKKIYSLVKSANADYCAVSTKEVVQLVEQEIGKAYSIRHIERIMHKLGFSLITPRPQHIRHDQEKVDAFRDEFKKNLSRSMWIMN